MLTAYGVDSGSILRVLDAEMYSVLFIMPWLVAGLVIVFVWLENKGATSGEGEESAEETIDFGVHVISAYQTILNQSEGRCVNVHRIFSFE